MEYAFASFIPKISNSFNKMPIKGIYTFSSGAGEINFLKQKDFADFLRSESLYYLFLVKQYKN